jgi:Ca-activated chloride channel family protein
MRSGSIFPDGCARAGVVLAVVLSVGLSAAQTGDSQAVYRARTDLVVLQVSVSDGQRRHVSGLQAENFTVFDEGVPQPVAVFATSDSPLDVMLLLDTSGSMGLRLPAARRAAADLVGRLRSDDRAGLILFDEGATIAHPLSDRHDSVIKAIRSVSPAGATALYEAVYLGLHTLSRSSRAADGVRRQALVVLTDGADNASRIPFEQALDAARRGDVTIFTIMPAQPPEAVAMPALSWREATARFELRRLAEDTGGRTFVTQDPTGVGDVYEQIGSELRAQYWLAYPAGPGNHGFRRVSVRVNDPPGLQARTRAGYHAGPRVTALSNPAARSRYSSSP